MATQVNVQPGHGKGGRQPTRQFLDTLSGHNDPGMFGRMFPKLPPLAVATGAAGARQCDGDANPDDPAGDNPNIPAGFTYLGQFVDHDITLDLTSLGEKESRPARRSKISERRPGSRRRLRPGSGRQPASLCAKPGERHGKTPGPKFLIGKTINVPFGNVTGDLRNDLPRSPEGFALIGDHRNDENLLVAQTHLAMLKFHNKVCDILAGGAHAAGRRFRRSPPDRDVALPVDGSARLRRTADRTGIVAKILHDGRKFYRFKKTPYMPVEFSAAAYRLGHSMVREVYSHNRVFTPGGGSATLNLLFGFTGLSGKIIGDLAPNPPTAPLPVPVLPSNWIIDWRRFYELRRPRRTRPDVSLNHSRKLDPFLVPQLHDLPGGGGNLAFRNLKRGVILGLPSGQDIATAMRIKNPLTPDEIATGPDGQVAKQHGLHHADAALVLHPQGGGGPRRWRALGPVGATHRGRGLRRPRAWRPRVVPLAKGQELEARLCRPTSPAPSQWPTFCTFVGDISPIDGIGRSRRLGASS